MPRRRRAAFLGACCLLVVAAGCSDDPIVMTKEQFIAQVKDFDNAHVDPGVASCAYDNIKQDASVMADLGVHGADNDRISDDTAQKLGRILARCIRGAEGATDATTTSSSTSSTTTSTTAP